MVRTSLVILALFVSVTTARAECGWMLWSQDEEFWSYALLNVFLGPSRKTPYIVGEYQSRERCLSSQISFIHDQMKLWETPEAKADIKKFGGLRRASSYACVPLPLKPTQIDHSGWK